MKRSHAIALGATGIILAGAWLGRAGNQRVSSDTADSGTDAAIYANISECIQGRTPAGGANEASLACEADFKAASESHVAAAPKFSSAGECEAQYGASQCRPASFNGASVFVPAMVGFMVANHLSNRRQPQALLPPQNGVPLCPPGMTPETQPGCVVPRTASSSGSSYGSGWRSYSTSSGHTVSRSDRPGASTVKVPTAAAAVPAARSSLGAVSAKSSSIGSPSRSSTAGSSGTTSRGGFGSTASSRSSGSSS